MEWRQVIEFELSDRIGKLAVAMELVRLVRRVQADSVFRYTSRKAKRDVGVPLHPMRAAYNQSIRGLVQQRANAGKHIAIVDMFTGCAP